jgi:coiled-coil domain-containing protein 130
MCKGLRFNAKKDKTGKYLSTTIFSFSMKCPSCPQEFLIKTDPQNMTYDFASGLRKMEQEFDAGAEDSIVKLIPEETKKMLEEDSIFRLEYEKEALSVAEASKKRLSSLLDINDKTRKNDYDLNCMLRKKNRTSRARSKELKREGEIRGLSIPLVEPELSDAITAKEMKFKPRHGGNFGSSERSKMTSIRSESIFTEGATSQETKHNSLQKQAKLLIKVGIPVGNKYNSLKCERSDFFRSSVGTVATVDSNGVNAVNDTALTQLARIYTFDDE